MSRTNRARFAAVVPCIGALCVAGPACQPAASPCAPCVCHSSDPPAAGASSGAPIAVGQPGSHDPGGTQGCPDGRSLPHALAVPEGKTGTIVLVVTDRPITCSEWAAGDRDPTGCAHWNARINLSPEAQRPGTYPVGKEFAYLSRSVLGPRGAWQDAPTCEGAGGDLEGTIEIVRMEPDGVVGKICGTRTEDPRSNGLLDGTFHAKRCPACGMTRDPCKTNADCCTRYCTPAGRCSM